MIAKPLALALVLFTVIATMSHAAPANTSAGNSALSPDNDSYINVNNILMFVTNQGGFGRDLTGFFGHDAGTFFPYTQTTPPHQYIYDGSQDAFVLYAGGLWLGGKVGSETRVAIAEYSTEFVPGPMYEHSFLPDCPDFKIYKLFKDSLADKPNSDYLNWPIDQGAPVRPDGSPAFVGHQMLWAVYNDANPDEHTNGRGATQPLGIEVQQTTWAESGAGPEGNTIYLKYKFYNKGVNAINDFYVSLWLDPDLGGSGDDFVGCDTLNDVFFCYNADNDDQDYGSKPPSLGYRIVHGPLVPSAGDSAVFDGAVVPDHRNLRMSSFAKYIIGTDPENYRETYNYMQGLRANGTDYMYDGSPTKFMHTGNPLPGLGDLDFEPGDRRMMASFGPFDFIPGDSQYVLIKMAVGQGSDRLNSITVMKSILAFEPAPSCCEVRGNVDHDPLGEVDIADLVYFVDYAFRGGPPPACWEEADLDASGVLDIGDLTKLIDFMFLGGSPPVPCR